MSIEISRLPESRWEEYRELRLEGLKNDPGAFASSYEEEVKFDKEIWINRIPNVLFALENGKPVGLITFIVGSRIKVKHTADIFGFYVKEKYRNMGIGTALVRKAISVIRENPAVRKINLSVSSTQEAAISLYRKEGFIEIGKGRDQFHVDGRYLDEIYMELMLQE